MPTYCLLTDMLDPKVQRRLQTTGRDGIHRAKEVNEVRRLELTSRWMKPDPLSDIPPGRVWAPPPKIDTATQNPLLTALGPLGTDPGVQPGGSLGETGEVGRLRPVQLTGWLAEIVS